MAYEFKGFFAKPPVPQPVGLPTGAVWRVIGAPFRGVGLLLPEPFSRTPEVPEVWQLAHQLGLAGADWLYLTYLCWGGRIEFVYGFGACGDRTFGPVQESDPHAVEGAYTVLMGEFGVSAADAHYFPPFVRGFWGERRPRAAPFLGADTDDG
jgi:hypothetical protein